MTTTLAKTNPQLPAKPSALNLMATRLNVEPAKLLDTLKATVFQKASNEELLALVTVSNEYGLNPFLKEIYAFPAKGGGIVPIVSVDGWNKMMNRHPEFDGIEFEMVDGEDGLPVTCTAVIHVKGRSKPIRITEYFAECKRNTEPWNNMPHRMLRNRTLCQASRVAFGFSGVYNDDEAAMVVDVESTPLPSAPPPKIVAAPEATSTSPQTELELVVFAAGFTLDQFRAWAKETGNVGHEFTSAEDIPTADAKRLLRSKDGLVASLSKMFPKEAK